MRFRIWIESDPDYSLGGPNPENTASLISIDTEHDENDIEGIAWPLTGEGKAEILDEIEGSINDRITE